VSPRHQARPVRWGQPGSRPVVPGQYQGGQGSPGDGRSDRHLRYTPGTSPMP